MSHEMVWTKIHDEREALLAELEQLSDEQWRSPSLCEGWTIQDVVAHLASGASTSKADVAKLVLKHKGDFQAVTDAGVAEYSKGTPAETLAAFKAVLHERTAPLSGEAMLGDTLVHAEDIRRPLGLTREYPLETLRELGDYYKDSSGLGVKKLIDGLHLMATDQKWDHGKGEIVQGPLLALIMTMTGRAEYLDDLAGDGLPEYREADAVGLASRLRAAGHSAERVAALLTQKRLQARAQEKFGEFAEGMLFTPDGLEQASRLEVAATHAGRYATASLATVHDLGCGIGADAMTMSSLGVTVHGVDVDPVTAAIADANLRPWPDSRARPGRDGRWPRRLRPARRRARPPAGSRRRSA